MAKQLQSQKIAILVANGFSEKEFILMQKSLLEQGANPKIISTDSGLVNGWDGAHWGHNFAVDSQLNTALGIDYDALVIPGGQRSIDKLKMTAHSRRFIGSFMAAMKPVICLGDAVQLLAYTDQLNGRTVSGPSAKQAVVETAGGVWSASSLTTDGALMTGDVDGDGLTDFIAGALQMMIDAASQMKKAA